MTATQSAKPLNKSGSSAPSLSPSIIRPLLALLLVITLSLSMLIYVAYIDAYRSYRAFLLDRVYSGGELVRESIEPLVQAGVPLNQLVGFNVVTQPILNSDNTIAEIAVVNTNNVTLFSNSQSLPEYSLGSLNPQPNQFTVLADSNINFEVYATDNIYQVRLPIESRFETVGYLQLFMKNEAINQSIYQYIRNIIIFAVAIIILYVITLVLFLRRQRASNFSLNLIFNITFLLVAAFLIINLVQIYSDGLQGKTRALADSLASRLESALELGLSISDFSEIDATFIEYKSLNPDIEYISLNINEVVLSHSDPENIGLEYQVPRGVIEYKRQIVGSAEDSIEIAVSIPRRLIYLRLARNVKNFTFLLFASALLAWLFLRILLSVNTNLNSKMHNIATADIKSRSKAILDLIFPTFFLANLIEGIHYSYLPQYLRELAINSGFAGGSEATLYSVFWACYTIILIPAGRFARTIEGIRNLLIVGFSLITISMLLLVSVDNFALMYLIRGLAGFGQGIVFIAVQSYILQSAKSGQLTQGVTIIVYGYNGGIISGTVIGALLVESLGVTVLFAVSALVAAMLIWYSLQVIGGSRVRHIFSSISNENSPPISQNVRSTMYKFGDSGLAVFGRQFWKNLAALFKDIEFTKTILCVGLIAKAVLAGVVFLALPQLLSSLNYRQEDIGQILMFYAAGVLIISRVIARYTDQIGNARSILFAGSVGSGIGLCVIALAQIFQGNVIPQTIAVISGILILGLAHGFIHAPIVTHISNSPMSQQLGKSVVASIYRFLERGGHIIGPIITGQILLSSQNAIGRTSLIGIAVIIFAIAFIVLPSRKDVLG